MDDTKICSVCGHKLRIFQKGNLKASSGKAYTEKLCINSNHVFQFFIDKDSKNIDILKISLGPNFSKIIEFNFVDKTTNITIMNTSKVNFSVLIPKLLELDFPDLESLKEKISLYMMYS